MQNSDTKCSFYLKQKVLIDEDFEIYDDNDKTIVEKSGKIDEQKFEKNINLIIDNLENIGKIDMRPIEQKIVNEGKISDNEKLFLLKKYENSISWLNFSEETEEILQIYNSDIDSVIKIASFKAGELAKESKRMNLIVSLILINLKNFEKALSFLSRCKSKNRKNINYFVYINTLKQSHSILKNF